MPGAPMHLHYPGHHDYPEQSRDYREPAPVAVARPIHFDRLDTARRRGVIGALHLAHKKHRDLLRIELEEGRITPQKRQHVKLIGDQRIVAALDHTHIMIWNTGLFDRIVNRHTAAFARAREKIPESRTLALALRFPVGRHGQSFRAFVAQDLSPPHLSYTHGDSI